jgi:hypothetical protein
MAMAQRLCLFTARRRHVGKKATARQQCRLYSQGVLQCRTKVAVDGRGQLERNQARGVQVVEEKRRRGGNLNAKTVEDAFALAPAHMQPAARVAPASAWPAPSRFGGACLLFRLVVHLNRPLLILALSSAPTVFRSNSCLSCCPLPRLPPNTHSLLVAAHAQFNMVRSPAPPHHPAHRPTTATFAPSCLRPANSPVQADSLTEEQVSEFKEAFSLFVGRPRLSPPTCDKRLLNRTDRHRTRTAMARSPPRSSAPSCARSARTPASRSCRT